MEALYWCWSRRNRCRLPWTCWCNPLQSLWHWLHHPCWRSYRPTNSWADCHTRCSRSWGLGCDCPWRRRFWFHWDFSCCWKMRLPDYEAKRSLIKWLLKLVMWMQGLRWLAGPPELWKGLDQTSHSARNFVQILILRISIENGSSISSQFQGMYLFMDRLRCMWRCWCLHNNVG